jgi:MoxR-like ATPase
MEIKLDLYQGKGQTIAQRNQKLPDYQPVIDDNPANYIADAPLQKAVNIAIALGMPLLVTGEPGTGKTQLAAAIAYELELPLFEFRTKTTSTATELFYKYDALRRFHDSQDKDKKIVIENYIEYQALGEAIRLAVEKQKRSVVLIDEIDKAPRDFSNDILNEIEKMTFTVKEMTEGQNTFKAEERFRPIVILTSNSEKNLPDAFLRRCMFYHIPFPSEDELKNIVERRIRQKFPTGFVDGAVKHLFKIREEKKNLRKRPGTAEFLAWICVLAASPLNLSDIANFNPAQKNDLALSYSVLAKNEHDLEMMKRG